jgi:hypothetical protein
LKASPGWVVCGNRVWSFRSSEANFIEIIQSQQAFGKTRLHHLHFDTDGCLDGCIELLHKCINCQLTRKQNGFAAVTVPVGQCVVLTSGKV